MNPLIEYFIKDRGLDGNFARKTTVVDHSDEILKLVKESSKAEIEEFLNWEAEAIRKPGQFQADLKADELRKRMEWEAEQNQLPGQFPNDDYAG